MIEIENKNFESMTIFIDNNSYSNCKFENCKIIFNATSPIAFNNCKFINVDWTMDGAAALTIKFLSAMYNGMGESGKTLVEQTFNNIRNNKI